MIEQKHLYVSQTTEHTIIQIHSVLKLLCKTVYKNIRPLIPLYIGCIVRRRFHSDLMTIAPVDNCPSSRYSLILGLNFVSSS